MKKICIAIDKSGDYLDLQSFTQQFGGNAMFKIGLEYFTKFGSTGLNKVQSELFLDLKFFDIPNTVYHAVRNVCTIKNIFLLTVHASGGMEMIKAAVQARNDSNSKAKIICVTRLTSENASIEDILSLTDIAIKANADGIVCSVAEVQEVRRIYGDGIIIVTPGIRPAWYNVCDDQVRTSTPKNAFDVGSNIVVIGRPITQSKTPAKALEKILEEIGSVKESLREI